ncbi:hypothetical protein [Runella slithyformis]|nr:hypothetical protein [Runella slithyformis]
MFGSVFFILFNLCTWGQSKVDLAIENITLKPSLPKIGDGVIISYDVKNIGTAIVPPEAYTATLSINGKVVSFDDESPKLLLQQHVTYSKAAGSYHFLVESKKKYNWQISVRLKKIKDDNSKNNSYQGSFVAK